MIATIDTNVLVSGLFAKVKGADTTPPQMVVNMLVNSLLTPCYNDAIIAEYAGVLHRPKFPFSDDLVDFLVQGICKAGMAVSPLISKRTFTDEEDRKFYDVAKTIGSVLVTGNTKHFPKEPWILTPREFVDRFQGDGR
ncbi:MAG: PIN domain-containing protein [Coriobacteriales bacterium]|jgi:predicted nucleic acid-binding protein|nr:PIN domain-containing protein [Coriobacteriales bacterium]